MGDFEGDIHGRALMAAARMSLFRSCKEVQGSPFDRGESRPIQHY